MYNQYIADEILFSKIPEEPKKDTEHKKAKEHAFFRFLNQDNPNKSSGLSSILKHFKIEEIDAGDAIAEFRFLAQSARRFVSRIEIRLKWEPTVPQLEALLTVTDKRAENIRAAWLEARRVAAQLGTDYDT